MKKCNQCRNAISAIKAWSLPWLLSFFQGSDDKPMRSRHSESTRRKNRSGRPRWGSFQWRWSIKGRWWWLCGVLQINHRWGTLASQHQDCHPKRHGFRWGPCHSSGLQGGCGRMIGIWFWSILPYYEFIRWRVWVFSRWTPAGTKTDLWSFPSKLSAILWTPPSIWGAFDCHDPPPSWASAFDEIVTWANFSSRSRLT